MTVCRAVCVLLVPSCVLPGHDNVAAALEMLFNEPIDLKTEHLHIAVSVFGLPVEAAMWLYDCEDISAARDAISELQGEAFAVVVNALSCLGELKVFRPALCQHCTRSRA